MRGYPVLCDSGRVRFDDVVRRSSCSRHVRPFLAVSGDGEVTGALWETVMAHIPGHIPLYVCMCVCMCACVCMCVYMCLLHLVWATLGQGVRKCVCVLSYVHLLMRTSTCCGQPSMCFMRSVITQWCNTQGH